MVSNKEGLTREGFNEQGVGFFISDTMASIINFKLDRQKTG